MTKRINAEIWVLTDTNGDYAVGIDADEARVKYEEQIGELAVCDGFRLVKVSLSVPLPSVAEVSGSIDIPEDEPVLNLAQ
jgi:hypothetical protein